ncbi:MAG: hypothetical protein V2J02_15680, partial [Pseudomonadales bacterium]|nr:hypothetical protein [Pseudomonadales bacterium]
MASNISNATLAQKISDLIAKWDNREKEFQAWLSGDVGAGPNSDGKYPLTDYLGTTRLTTAPAQLEDDVLGAVGAAQAASTAASDSETNAAASEAAAAASASSAESYRDTALSYKNDAETAEAGAINAQNNAIAQKQAAQAARDKAEKWAEEDQDVEVETGLYSAKHWALTAQDFVPAIDTGAYRLTADPVPWADLSGVPSTFTPASHGHDWADLSNLPAFATRWPSWTEVTSKPSTFTPSAHTHGNADITDVAWSKLTGVPSTFAPSSHGHAWGDLSGVPSFATRWPTWSEVTSKPTTFAPSAHTHPWAEVTGAPATATRWPSWGEVTSKPTTFAPSAHGHAIADVTGLQAALDGKAAASHTHSYLPLSGGTLTGNLEIDRASDSYIRFRSSGIIKGYLYSNGSSQTGFLNNTGGWKFRIDNDGTMSVGSVPWARLTGVPSTFAPSAHTHDYLPLAGGTMTGAIDFVGTSISDYNTVGAPYGGMRIIRA